MSYICISVLHLGGGGQFPHPSSKRGEFFPSKKILCSRGRTGQKVCEADVYRRVNLIGDKKNQRHCLSEIKLDSKLDFFSPPSQKKGNKSTPKANFPIWCGKTRTLIFIYLIIAMTFDLPGPCISYISASADQIYLHFLPIIIYILCKNYETLMIL